jgi:hypothetical protein
MERLKTLHWEGTPIPDQEVWILFHYDKETKGLGTTRLQYQILNSLTPQADANCHPWATFQGKETYSNAKTVFEENAQGNSLLKVQTNLSSLLIIIQ